MRKKKAPCDLFKQLSRIYDNMMCRSWKDGKPSRIARIDVCKKLEELTKTYRRYVDNIYKLHHVDQYQGSAADANSVWYNAIHDSKEYMNIKA